jgi:hypothetical protein
MHQSFKILSGFGSNLVLAMPAERGGEGWRVFVREIWFSGNHLKISK